MMFARRSTWWAMDDVQVPEHLAMLDLWDPSFDQFLNLDDAVAPDGSSYKQDSTAVYNDPSIHTAGSVDPEDLHTSSFESNDESPFWSAADVLQSIDERCLDCGAQYVNENVRTSRSALVFAVFDISI